MSENTSNSVVSKTAAEFVGQNPTLGLNQIGLESDTLLIKVGDCVTAWNDLDYTAPSANAFEQVLSCLATKIPSSKAVCDSLSGGAFPVNLNAPIYPPQITANQNDYNPAGFQTANIMLINSNAPRDITGLIAPVPVEGRVMHILNNGTKNITLKNNDAASLAANRFELDSNVTFGPNDGVILVYGILIGRWRMTGSHI